MRKQDSVSSLLPSSQPSCAFEPEGSQAQCREHFLFLSPLPNLFILKFDKKIERYLQPYIHTSTHTYMTPLTHYQIAATAGTGPRQGQELWPSLPLGTRCPSTWAPRISGKLDQKQSSLDLNWCPDRIC